LTPTHRRAEGVARTGFQTSHFARRVLALPKSEQLNTLQNPPWLPQETHEAAQQRIRAQKQTKEQAAACFRDFYSSLPQTDIKIFSDGSKLRNGMTGVGFAIYQSGRPFQQTSFSLGPNKEAFDAEAEAALAGFKAALRLDTARLATNLWVCLDNLEVATRLLSPFMGLSQEFFDSFRTHTLTWLARERFPYTDGGSVRVCWVPGHMQIPENGAADEAAMAPPSSIEHSHASLKRWAKANTMKVFQM
jgi:ribonuclease HI